MNPKHLKTIAEEIASRLLTPHGYTECHRLKIMERVGPLVSDERSMGGHNKNSIVNVVFDVLNERLPH